MHGFLLVKKIKTSEKLEEKKLCKALLHRADKGEPMD